MRELVKKTYIILYKCMFNIYYAMTSFLKKNDHNKAVFVLTREDKLQGNLQFVHSELLKQLPEVKIHFVYAENKMNLKLFKELNIINDAKYLIIDDYYLPVYLIKPKKQLKVIQLWHAAGAFKKFGHSTVGTKFGPSKDYLKIVPVHSNYTNVYVSSQKMIPFYAEAFHMEEDQIYPLGIPRIDMFSDENMKKQVFQQIYNRYPQLKDEKFINILIAPTYRAVGSQGESNFSMNGAMIDVIPSLKENIRILYKPHPYTSEQELAQLQRYTNVVIADHFTLNEWMLVSDAFITDYSSAIFDFALLYKPFVHYVPDLREYEENRGFYQPIEQISDGEIIQTEEKLIQWINNRAKKEYFDTSNMIEYNFSHTKYVTRSIVEHFIEKV